MNRSTDKRARQPNPVSNASILSKLTFWWLKPIFKIGLSRSIEEDDIYAVTNSMKSDRNTEVFANLWQSEIKKKNPSILSVMLKIHGFKLFIFTILFSIGEMTARVIQPICLGGFVSYFAATAADITLNDAYWYASGIVCSTAFMSIAYHPFILYTSKTACQIRVACSGLVYQKILRLSKSTTEDGQSGHIINLLSNDLTKLDIALSFIADVLKSPIEALLFFIVIYKEIGTAAVVGMIFLCSFIPLQGFISKKTGQLRMKNTKRTDVRVKIMNEILHGIQVIKMYAWEYSFAKLVDQIRKKEVNAFRSIAYLRAVIKSLKMIPKISIFLTLVSYVYCGNVITARKVFIVSSYFNILSTSMVYFWPIALMSLAEAKISIRRLEEFLLRPESTLEKHRIHDFALFNQEKMADGCNNQRKISINADEESLINSFKMVTNESTSKRLQKYDSLEKSILFDKVKAVWQQNENEVNGIFDINLEIKPGLCAIVGQVGSGKSTLLNAILGELHLEAGSLTINGTLSYASQEPWIFDGSVKSNIVFVEDFDEQRYNRVVEVCALERDFKLLPHGDATIVGERGSSLSGGQRARINLARAIYKSADIYLLDDPLSAVDAHVGRHIFDKCIKEFLKDKICILVTHQLQYLMNEQHVVLLNCGKIEAEGPFQQMKQLHDESMIQTQEDFKVDNNNNVNTIETIPQNFSSVVDEEEIENDTDKRKETQASGSIKFSTYQTYFQAANSSFVVIFVIILFIAAQIAWSGSDFFLAEWVNWEEQIMRTNLIEYPQPTNVNNITVDVNDSQSNSLRLNREYFLIIYTCIMGVGTVCYTIRSFAFFRMCLKISINLHDLIFRGISRAKMIFFNNNPSGRILNRFSGDINNIDSLLPSIMGDVLDFFLQYLAIVIITTIVNPWLLIPAAFLTLIFYLLRMVFVSTGRSFKRIEALSRSPVFSHVNATLQGSATIRAFNANAILESEFHEFQDHNTSSAYLFICASRWFAFWLDVMCFLFISVVTYSFLILGDSMEMQSGNVGLAILTSINLINACQWGMRQTADLENQMTSVERVIEYAKLPSEPSLESTTENAPPFDWPSQGNIEFKSLSLRYEENGDRVLKNLSFHIDAKQRVGVVGRTGAGKSSIVQSLFRLAQNEGQISIDGVDIGLIGLHDLRRKISIIPQEAILFSGSLRFNLDPFDERSDDELWAALEQVELKAVIAALPGGLDAKVIDGGLNFSAGQRQLLCLARAILRNNKILILDEATANVDSETDKLIQKTIRNRFTDCTVITIAHRLNTIMDCDRVLVVDAGEIVEFDHPFNLIQRPDGCFKRLLDQTDSSTAMILMNIAKVCYEKSMAL